MPTAAKKDRIRREGGFRCFFCEEPATTVDHLVPRSQGGTNDDENLVACCRRCNEIKSNHAHPVNSHGPTATGCTHSSEYRPSYVSASCVAASPSKDRKPLNG